MKRSASENFFSSFFYLLRGEIYYLTLDKTNPHLSGVAHGNCEGRDVAPKRGIHQLIMNVTKGLVEIKH